ncbi:hypothetical protein LCGC14_0146490 [marine sediment metagenome]|uniref:Uncharacterized protein n=1 Tax=marine sediment metagenome TaxID=412755 RepID=A0A0F9Y1H1_9ZZZZ
MKITCGDREVTINGDKGCGCYCHSMDVIIGSGKNGFCGCGCPKTEEAFDKVWNEQNKEGNNG